MVAASLPPVNSAHLIPAAGEAPTPERLLQLQRLLQRLGLAHDVPVNWSWLDLALTHPTLNSADNNDRLEFLGDSVLRLLASRFLYEHYPKAAVGILSDVRSVLVSDAQLAAWARLYDLGAELEASPYLKHNASALADAFEALLGALYLSTSDLSLIEPWLLPHLQVHTETVLDDPARTNYKAALQEWTQGHYQCLPEYRLLAEAGPPTPHYVTEVWLQDRCLGRGEGRSKKASQQAAARVAFNAVHPHLAVPAQPPDP